MAASKDAPGTGRDPASCKPVSYHNPTASWPARTQSYRILNPESIKLKKSFTRFIYFPDSCPPRFIVDGLPPSPRARLASEHWVINWPHYMYIEFLHL